MLMYYLAIDIGASSGRHIVGEVKEGKIELTEVYRFDNNLIEKNGHLCWDTEVLFENIVAGLKAAGEKGMVPESVAIDTWGVDFVLLDSEDKVIGDTVAYRDKRTEPMIAKCEEIMPFTELYSKAGIQKMNFNTVYQLLAIKSENPEYLEKAQRFLMIPEYFNFLLTGNKANEYTNASTTSLLNAAEKTWDKDILNTLGFPERIFGKLNMPGTLVGNLKAEIAEKVGYQTKVLLAPSHDTASAFLSVPAKDDNAVYISSGTWSLLGVENAEANTSKEALESSFTNEGGYLYRYRFLKNIMGLWIIQSIRRNLNKKYSFAELENFAKEETGFKGRINVNEECFLAPESMIDTVTEKATVKPENIGQIMECVYRSLAEGYKEAIVNLEKVAGKKFTSINVVGGGSKDTYLDKLTAETTGLTLYAGPTEGTALGNLMSQMIENKEFTSLQDARNCVKKSFDIKKFTV
ncbi:MAG: rhamnulokinase [Ruminococcaceae bacterium]|nr:rhamnulokinase [Oscillospiraceae bacterium]